jgi:hypothetical protein
MMATVRVIAAAIALCAVVPALQAQERPNFSGEWIRAADSTAGRPAVAATGDAAFARGDMGSGWGTPLTIKQDSSRLSVQYVFFSSYDLQPPILLLYALDGSESRNNLNIGHTTSEQRSRATWEGSTLVITTRSAGPAGPDGRPVPVETRQVLSLQSPTMLRVVTTRAGVLGGSTTTTTVTYNKR